MLAGGLLLVLALPPPPVLLRGVRAGEGLKKLSLGDSFFADVYREANMVMDANDFFNFL
jgi:hypothetical protein